MAAPRGMGSAAAPRPAQGYEIALVRTSLSFPRRSSLPRGCPALKKSLLEKNDLGGEPDAIRGEAAVELHFFTSYQTRSMHRLAHP